MNPVLGDEVDVFKGCVMAACMIGVLVIVVLAMVGVWQ